MVIKKTDFQQHLSAKTEDEFKKIEGYIDDNLRTGPKTFQYSSLIPTHLKINEKHSLYNLIKVRYEAVGWTVKEDHGDMRMPYHNIHIS